MEMEIEELMELLEKSEEELLKIAKQILNKDTKHQMAYSFLNHFEDEDEFDDIELNEEWEWTSYSRCEKSILKECFIESVQHEKTREVSFEEVCDLLNEDYYSSNDCYYYYYTENGKIYEREGEPPKYKMKNYDKFKEYVGINNIILISKELGQND